MRKRPWPIVAWAVLPLLLAVVAVPQLGAQAAESPRLQPFYYQDLAGVVSGPGGLPVSTVNVNDLPTRLTLGVRDISVGLELVSSGEPIAFSVDLPTPLREVARFTEYNAPCSGAPTTVCFTTKFRAQATFPLPEVLPCGSYPTRASSFPVRGGDTYYADGRLDVVGCPPILSARPPLTVRAAPGPLPFTFSGRYFPSGFNGEGPPAPLIELHLDGDPTPLAVVTQGARPVPTTSFDVPKDLDLACGRHRVTATVAGKELARDDFEVRCPAVTLAPPQLDKRTLPRTTTATGTGFGRTALLDVLLDGLDVGDVTTSIAGTAVFAVPVPASASCGPHQVTLRQRARAAQPSATAVLLVICPQAPTPGILNVSPEVVPAGFTARVTGAQLPPGPIALVWDLGGGVRRPATGNQLVTVRPDGTLDLSVLILGGEPIGRRTLVAVDPDGPDAGTLRGTDAAGTLVVLSSFQPGRRSSSSGVGVLGRR